MVWVFCAMRGIGYNVNERCRQEFGQAEHLFSLLRKCKQFFSLRPKILLGQTF